MKKKALLLTLSAVALAAATMFGTMAYLTDADENVNTFTVGHVNILLDELDVDKNTETDTNDTDITTGKGTDKQRDKANQYHLIPGQTYTKDPTVTVEANSESSYVYMTVTVKGYKGLTEALSGDDYYHNGVFLLQNLCDWQADSDWLYKGCKVTGEGEAQIAEYRFVYGDGTTQTVKAVAGGIEDNKLPALFTKITVPGEDITSANIDELANVDIVVNAYAVQESGFNTDGKTYNDAWKSGFGNNVDIYDLP